MIASSVGAQAEELTKNITLTAFEYPPFSGKALMNGGVCLDLVAQAFSRVGYRVTFIFLPFSRTLFQSKRGSQYGLARLWFSQERAESFVFSEPYFYNEMKILKKTSRDLLVSNLQDFKQYLGGSVRGYVLPPDMESLGLRLEMVNSDAQNLRMLVAERIDYMIVDKFTAKYITLQELPNNFNVVEFLDFSFAKEPNYLAISKKRKDAKNIVEDFNLGMRLIIKDGEYRRTLVAHGFDD